MRLAAEKVRVVGRMVKDLALEVPPPAPVTTVRVACPGAARREAGTEAVRREADTKVVVRGFPFQSTVEKGWKEVPLTVRVKAGAPAFRDPGLRDRRLGCG
jgi:hypothetical protein